MFSNYNSTNLSEVLYDIDQISLSPQSNGIMFVEILLVFGREERAVIQV